MAWQDEDIKKLKHYAKAHGLKVSIRRKKTKDFSAEYVSNESITVYTTKRTSKKDIILTLLHELGHHLDSIIGKPDSKETIEALNKAHNEGIKNVPREQRRLIYRSEKSGIELMPYFVSYLKLRIDRRAVEIQKRIDIFAYKFYMDNGRFPTQKENRRYIRKLKR